jgi:NAD(P)-dependent dehydrogenase (short-subunit alcohol dehydrogenase family)
VASKGAVMGMTRVLAKEMGEDGIPVNAAMHVHVGYRYCFH